MRPNLISISRRYFRLSSSSISSSSSSSNCIFHSRNHASSSSAPLFKNSSSSDNSSSSAYNKDVTFTSFFPPLFRNIKKSPNLFPFYSRNHASSSSAPLFKNSSSSDNSSSSAYNKDVTFTSFSSPPSILSFYISVFNCVIGAQPFFSNDSNLDWDENGGPMTDFLTTFTWIMKRELIDDYPDTDKETINAMLLIIISELEKGGLVKLLDLTSDHNPSQYFNQDLWEAIWDVSNVVFRIMISAKGNFNETSIPSSYVGTIRRGTLREMIFKWKIAYLHEFEEEAMKAAGETVENNNNNVEEEKKNKKPEIKYYIYGLDLSDPRFAEIIDRIHEADKLITPGKPKKINGKCKLVHEKILSLKTEEEDLLLSSLLTEWTEILQPNRIDWLILLDNIKQRNLGLYFKMAEHVLDEDSFQANSRDYLKLMHAHTNDNRLDDAERILRKMTDKGGIQPDILTSTILVQMYSKTNNVERAKAAFHIMTRGYFPPDIRTNKSMITTILNATQRTDNKMHFLNMQPDLESRTLLVEAHDRAAGDPEQARRNIDDMIRLGYKRQVRDPEQARRTFDDMIRMGYRPDDRCTSSMFAAYGNKKLLDNALILFIKLEKYGVVTEPSVYSAMIDWCRERELVIDQELLRLVNEKGDTPPLKAV